MTATTWVVRAGTARRDDFDLVVSDADEGWQHTSLLVASLGPGESRVLATHGWEYVVVPLAGAVDVAVAEADGQEHAVRLTGRDSVFSGATDTAYVPRDAQLRLDGAGTGSRVALCGARATRRPEPLPFRHLGVDEVPVEMRGAGSCSREVRNFAVPDVLDADSIIACEVLTPAGNWSSYPPHKHDREEPGVETELEEIYYFETRREPRAGVVSSGGSRVQPEPDADPIGYLRVYGTDERPLDVLAEVRTGDAVLVPHGWHGPAMAPPGYDLYYLNVMAGPGPARAWLICDDPQHGWVRETWDGQPTDPRLPFGENR